MSDKPDFANGYRVLLQENQKLRAELAERDVEIARLRARLPPEPTAFDTLPDDFETGDY